MEQLRARIVALLQDDFPEMKDSIEPFINRLDTQTDGIVSYKSPGVMVCFVNAQPAPADKVPWDLEVFFGLVVTISGGRAIDRDKEGWLLTSKVAKSINHKTFGFSRLEITPASIQSISVNEQRKVVDGKWVLTGTNYWTILFSNLVVLDKIL